MARFRRLVVADLDTLTRAELIDRLEEEQKYWFRKQARGFSDQDRADRKVFEAIMQATLGDLAEGIHSLAELLRGRTSVDYFKQVPGSAAYEPPSSGSPASVNSSSVTSESR